MDFIKKNWGLVASGAVSLGVAIFILLRIFSLGGQAVKSTESLQEQESFFNKAEQSRLKLKADPGKELENLTLAQQNFEKAEGYYNDLRKSLGETYHIAYRIPSTQTEALRMLSDKVGELHEFALKNEMEVTGLGSEYTAILTGGSLSNNEFGPLFRQLSIYEYLLERIAEAGIKTVTQIKWPMFFSNRDEDIYTMTPVRLSLIGEVDSLQKFLNMMMNDKKMLFNVKHLTFIAPDQFFPALAVYRGFKENNNFEDDLGMNVDVGRQSAQPQTSAGRPRRPERRQVAPTNFGMGRPDLGNSASSSNRLIVLPPKRQDFLVYEPKQVSMDLRLDLYEFKKLDAPQ